MARPSGAVAILRDDPAAEGAFAALQKDLARRRRTQRRHGARKWAVFAITKQPPQPTAGIRRGSRRPQPSSPGLAYPENPRRRWLKAEIRVVEGAGHTLYDPGVRDAVMKGIADIASKVGR